MTQKIHFVVRQDPIAHHGQDQVALCGRLIARAQPVLIVPDAVVLSVGMIADSFGQKMCRFCRLREPGEGYVYFLTTSEHVEEMRKRFSYMEVS